MKTYNKILHDFGLRVQFFRMKLGLSQEKLAYKAGFHRTYIGTVERGETNITLLNIHKLADALGVTVHDLLDNPPI